MLKGSYPRLLGFFATLAVPALATRAIFGEAELKQVLPILLSLPFGALAIMALASGQVWFAERGGCGAYRISRAKEPISYWVTVGMWGATSVLFLSALLR